MKDQRKGLLEDVVGEEAGVVVVQVGVEDREGAEAGEEEEEDPEEGVHLDKKLLSCPHFFKRNKSSRKSELCLSWH